VDLAANVWLSWLKALREEVAAERFARTGTGPLVEVEWSSRDAAWASRRLQSDGWVRCISGGYAWAVGFASSPPLPTIDNETWGHFVADGERMLQMRGVSIVERDDEDSRNPPRLLRKKGRLRESPFPWGVETGNFGVCRLPPPWRGASTGQSLLGWNAITEHIRKGLNKNALGVREVRRILARYGVRPERTGTGNKIRLDVAQADDVIRRELERAS
jgi:hypothetical protein